MDLNCFVFDFVIFGISNRYDDIYIDFR